MLSTTSRRSRAAILTIALIAFGIAPATSHAEPRNANQTDTPRAAVPTSRQSEAPPLVAQSLLARCPLDGAATFEDSWGWARSGGRKHQGVDMIAGRGTPVIAVRDGFAQFKNNSLGGRAIWLTTDDGDRFYYAHLDGWAGDSRNVEAGELIGYVGSTGNAKGPHLHFETHPGGNVENPFPHTLGACVPKSLGSDGASNEQSDDTSGTPTVPRRSMPLG